MAWRIHRWSAETGIGEVVSPHFGPWRFGANENPDGTIDFVLGEEVRVELDGQKDNYKVRSVVRLPRRAEAIPEGTKCAEFERLNAGRHGDMAVEHRSETLLKLWVGDCCSRCSDSWLVTFSGVSLVRGLDDDADLDEPVFRCATEDEVRLQGFDVSDETTVYRIVTTPLAERPRTHGIFVVAERVEAAFRPAVQ